MSLVGVCRTINSGLDVKIVISILPIIGLSRRNRTGLYGLKNGLLNDKLLLL